MHLRFAVAFNTASLVSGSVTEKKKLPKLECAGKKLFEASCVRNFRNPIFAILLLFEILGHFQKLFWAKILGVRNFRTFTVYIDMKMYCIYPKCWDTLSTYHTFPKI